MLSPLPSGITPLPIRKRGHSHAQFHSGDRRHIGSSGLHHHVRRAARKRVGSACCFRRDTIHRHDET
ncbi:MAG TPA: hypothetical protein DHB48_02640, partial [Sphingobium sp.]|nr:hypothetical protein [Sphingobium sp.]